MQCLRVVHNLFQYTLKKKTRKITACRISTKRIHSGMYELCGGYAKTVYAFFFFFHFGAILLSEKYLHRKKNWLSLRRRLHIGIMILPLSHSASVKSVPCNESGSGRAGEVKSLWSSCHAAIRFVSKF